MSKSIRPTLFSFLFTLGLATTAHAVPTVYVVNDTRDLPDLLPADGVCRVNSPPGPAKCTLRAAVQQANVPGLKTAIINVPGGTYNLINNDADGDEDLDVTRTMTIRPIEGESVLIQVGSGGNGDGKGRVFDVQAGTLTLEGIQIANSRTVAGYEGGCLRVGNGAGLTLDNTDVFNCRTTDSDGGAVHNQGTLTLKAGSDLSLNRTYVGATPAARGGSIYNGASGTIQVEGLVTIDDSYAKDGGGIYNAHVVSGANLMITDSKAERGGAVYSTGTFAMSGFHALRNTATDGGAIFQHGSGLSLLNNSTLTLNRADLQGGGLYVEGEPTDLVFLTGVVAQLDEAWHDGGGVYSAGPKVILMNTTFANETSRRMGGAIASIGDVECVLNCAFTDNRCWALGTSSPGSECGGAIQTAERATLFAATLSGNGAPAMVDVRGGAIAAAHVTITSSTFVANSTTGAGGAVYVVEDGTVESSTFYANESSTDGGAITTSPTASTVAIYSSTFIDNFAAGYGATLKVMNGTLSLANTVIIDITDTNSVYCDYGSVDSLGYNFLTGIESGCALTGAFAHDTNGTNTTALLDSLAAHGGYTQTVAMAGASVLIDGGNPAGCVGASGTTLTADQRGATRSFDGNADGIARCDIGAYEFGATDGYVAFTSSASTVSEGAGAVIVTVTRYGALYSPVSVTCSPVAGSASTSDFATAASTLSWAAGTGGAQSFAIVLTDDALDEGNETFTIECAITSGVGEVGAPHSVTIVDND